MRSQIPTPVKGEDLRASWGSAVASRVNALCAMAPSGMLSRDGFGGMGAQPLPQNLRARASYPKPSCFDLAIVTDEETGDPTYQLVNCYYNTGGITHHAADVDITSLVNDATDGGILAFAREGYEGDWEARLFESESDLGDFQQIAANYAFPLYILAARQPGESGLKVSLDLRRAPQLQMVEVLSP